MSFMTLVTDWALLLMGVTLFGFALFCLVRRKVVLLPGRFGGKPLYRSERPVLFYVRVFSLITMGLGLCLTGAPVAP